ncbi:SDR family NAD(P)-dependent oxidoreductase [Bernardetia sp.]|uniref:SDR family NAD(P)-dependent oxidoreductase n=1 Tax=Bernardetia sp. TaxID=1937974 RepID=UPI0025C43233|nr:SDR family oxidoreductase [Bernardetia sp.]
MKVALITGASSGIGLELAHVMAKEKHNLVLVARSIDKLNSLAEELIATHGIKVKTYKADLSNASEIENLYKQTKEDDIEVSYLINNAGFGEYGDFSENDWDKLNTMMQLNMVSLVHLTKLYSKDMVSSSFGKIMNVASTAAFQPLPYFAVYAATKSFVLSFSEAIASELKDHGITVTALCPGLTDTGFVEAANMEDTKFLDKAKAGMATSEEVAEYGYEAMMKGKTVAVHGMINSIMVNSSRFLPRDLVTTIAKKVQE